MTARHLCEFQREPGPTVSHFRDDWSFYFMYINWIDFQTIQLGGLARGNLHCFGDCLKEFRLLGSARLDAFICEVMAMQVT